MLISKKVDIYRTMAKMLKSCKNENNNTVSGMDSSFFPLLAVHVGRVTFASGE